MENSNNPGQVKSCAKSCATKVVLIGTAVLTFLLMVFLVKQMVKIASPSPVGAARAHERAKINGEVRAAAADEARSYGHLAEPSTARAAGVIRIPLEEAKKQTLQGYQNPGAFR